MVRRRRLYRPWLAEYRHQNQSVFHGRELYPAGSFSAVGAAKKASGHLLLNGVAATKKSPLAGLLAGRTFLSSRPLTDGGRTAPVTVGTVHLT